MYNEVSEAMSAEGYFRTAMQVRIKYYPLRSSFRELKNSQGTSGVGFETTNHGQLLFQLFGHRPAAKLKDAGVDSGRNMTEDATQAGGIPMDEFVCGNVGPDGIVEIDDPHNDVIDLINSQTARFSEEILLLRAPPPVQPPPGSVEPATLELQQEPQRQPHLPQRQPLLQQPLPQPPLPQPPLPQPPLLQPPLPQPPLLQPPLPQQPLPQLPLPLQPLPQQALPQQPLPQQQPQREQEQPQQQRRLPQQEPGHDFPLPRQNPEQQRAIEMDRQLAHQGAGDIADVNHGIAGRMVQNNAQQDALRGVRRGPGRLQDRTKGKGSYAKALTNFHEQWSQSQRELQENIIERHETFMRLELEASRRWEEHQQELHQQHTKELIESSNIALSSAIEKLLGAFNKPPEPPQVFQPIPYPVTFPQHNQFPYPINVSTPSPSPNSIHSAPSPGNHNLAPHTIARPSPSPSPSSSSISSYSQHASQSLSPQNISLRSPSPSPSSRFIPSSLFQSNQSTFSHTIPSPDPSTTSLSTNRQSSNTLTTDNLLTKDSLHDV